MRQRDLKKDPPKGKLLDVQSPSMPTTDLERIAAALIVRAGIVTAEDIRNIVYDIPTRGQKTDRIIEALVLNRLAECGSYMALDSLVEPLRGLGMVREKASQMIRNPLIVLSEGSTPCVLQYLYNRSLLPSYQSVATSPTADKTGQRISDNCLISPEEALSRIQQDRVTTPILILDSSVLTAVNDGHPLLKQLLKNPRIQLVLPIGWNFEVNGISLDRLRDGTLTRCLVDLCDTAEAASEETGRSVIDNINTALMRRDPVLSALRADSKLREFDFGRVFTILPKTNINYEFETWRKFRGQPGGIGGAIAIHTAAHMNCSQPLPQTAKIWDLIQSMPDELRKLTMHILEYLPNPFSYHRCATICHSLWRQIQTHASKHIVFLASDRDESNQLISDIFKRATGVPSSLFCSFSELSSRMSNEKIKEIVILDDFLGSGETVAKTIRKTISQSMRPTKVWVTSLASTSFGEKNLLTEFGNLVQVLPGSLALTYQEHESYISPPIGFTQDQVRAVVGKAHTGSKHIGTSLVFPWGSPNNNVLLMGPIAPWFTHGGKLIHRPGGRSESYSQYVNRELFKRNSPYREADRESTEPLYVGYKNPATSFISNLGFTPFSIDGIEFSSVEAFIQYIKYKSHEGNETLKNNIRTSYGLEARGFGKQANHQILANQAKSIPSFVYWQDQEIPYGSPKHHDLIERAIRLKFTQSTTACSQLLATENRELKHSTQKSKFSQITSLSHELFCSIITSIRTQLQDRLRHSLEPTDRSA